MLRGKLTGPLVLARVHFFAWAALIATAPPSSAAESASSLSISLSQSLLGLRQGVCGSSGQVFALRRGEEIEDLLRRVQAERELASRGGVFRKDEPWTRDRLQAIAKERDAACRVRSDGLGAVRAAR